MMQNAHAGLVLNQFGRGVDGEADLYWRWKEPGDVCPIWKGVKTVDENKVPATWNRVHSGATFIGYKG